MKRALSLVALLAVGCGQATGPGLLPVRLRQETLFETEKISAVKGYLRWQLLQDRSGDLDRAFIDEDFRFTDPRSPGKLRVNGPLSSLPAFREAFSCPAKAPMVRATPCKVW